MNHPSRRYLLRGAGGATLALPWLEAFASLAVAKASGDAFLPPTRAAFILFPNGVRTPTWFPAKTGALAAADLPEALQPLAPVIGDVTVFSGLANNLCKDSPHHRAIAGFLTGAAPLGGKVFNGISADQFIARRTGQFTQLPSLELGLPEVLQKQGNCDGYSCVYTRNIAWSTPTSPVPKEINPRNAFNRIFRRILEKQNPPPPGSPGDEKAAARAIEDDASVLDYVLQDATRLRRSLGAADRDRLDQYLQSVREVEERVNRVIVPETHRGAWTPGIPDNLARLRPETPTSIDEHLRAMMDLIALAFQTDSTRVATLMLGYGSSWNSYPDSGVGEQHHTVSHYGENSGKADLYTRLNRYHAGCFAYLVEKMRSIPEGDGSLLDHSLLLFGSELGHGASHTVQDLPVLLAGRAGGTLAPGRHLAFERGTPMANLLLEILNRMQLGEDIASFGESTGGLSGLV